MKLTKRIGARCVYACGVLHSHTKLTKRDERIIMGCATPNSHKRRPDSSPHMNRMKIAGCERLSRLLGNLV